MFSSGSGIEATDMQNSLAEKRTKGESKMFVYCVYVCTVVYIWIGISVNKTIYVRDEDVPTWEKAKGLAGDKLSPIIASALKRYVAEEEWKQKGFERIEYCL